LDWESAYILGEFRRWFSAWQWQDAISVLERITVNTETFEDSATNFSTSQSDSAIFPPYFVLQQAPKSIFTAIDWRGKVEPQTCGREFRREAFLRDLESVVEGSLDAVVLLNLLANHGTAVGVDIHGAAECVSLYDLIKHRLTLLSCRKHSTDPERPYLFVGGDLSGIQSFIYTINPDGALRTLRARSYFVELIVEHVIAQILGLWSLGRYHVVYSAGGGFYLLLPNHPNLVAGIERIVDDLNAWLLRTQGGRLYLATGAIALSDQDLADTSSVWGRLAEQTGRKKGQRYLRELQSAAGSNLDPLRIRQPGDAACAVCQADDRPLKLRDIGDDVRHLCGFCDTMLEWGPLLPKAIGIEVWDRLPNGGSPLEINGVFYRLVAKDQTPDPQATEYWPFDLGEVPLHARHVVNAPGYVALDEDGHALTFEKLANRATGAKLLGVLRMDVDHLGRIFSRGLPQSQRDLMHLGILSRDLTAFFKRDLRRLCEQAACQGRGNFHVVYAGGDDLFMVGTWSDLAPFAMTIQAEFANYTAHNPGVTISGGFIVESAHTPLYRLAELAGEAEDISKDEGRNRLTMFYTERGLHYADKREKTQFLIAQPWNELRAAYKDLFVPLHALELAQTFYQFSLSFVDLLERGKAHFAHYLYYLARMSVDKRYEQDWNAVKSRLVERTHFEAWKTVFAWLKLYRQRGEVENAADLQ
jgi:CRISPR-associated protein Csm1